MSKIYVFLVAFNICTMSYAQETQKLTDVQALAMPVLDEFMKAFNALDMEALEETIHFPHYRLAHGEMMKQDKAGQLPVEVMRKAIGAEWDHSNWLERKVISWDENKIHVHTKVGRYRKDGSLISTFNSLYILTKENGSWGIKMRSSFADQ